MYVLYVVHAKPTKGSWFGTVLRAARVLIIFILWPSLSEPNNCFNNPLGKSSPSRSSHLLKRSNIRKGTILVHNPGGILAGLCLDDKTEYIIKSYWEKTKMIMSLT